jgi:hypothetical protein
VTNGTFTTIDDPLGTAYPAPVVSINDAGQTGLAARQWPISFANPSGSGDTAHVTTAGVMTEKS